MWWTAANRGRNAGSSFSTAAVLERILMFVPVWSVGRCKTCQVLRRVCDLDLRPPNSTRWQVKKKTKNINNNRVGSLEPRAEPGSDTRSREQSGSAAAGSGFKVESSAAAGGRGQKKEPVWRSADVLQDEKKLPAPRQRRGLSIKFIRRELFSYFSEKSTNFNANWLKQLIFTTLFILIFLFLSFLFFYHAIYLCFYIIVQHFRLDLYVFLLYKKVFPGASCILWL